MSELTELPDYYEGTMKRTSSNSAGLPCYAMVFDTDHPNTVIVANNKAEFAYILKWCEINNVLPPYLGERETFPIALSVNGGGWTQHMDRALYYARFKDFVSVTA